MMLMNVSVMQKGESEIMMCLIRMTPLLHDIMKVLKKTT